MSDPKTYWEKRCNINEQVLDLAIKILMVTTTPAQQDAMEQLYAQWTRQLEDLDK